MHPPLVGSRVALPPHVWHTCGGILFSSCLPQCRDLVCHSCHRVRAPVVSPAFSTGHLIGAQYVRGEGKLRLQILVFAISGAIEKDEFSGIGPLLWLPCALFQKVHPPLLSTSLLSGGACGHPAPNKGGSASLRRSL